MKATNKMNNSVYITDNYTYVTHHLGNEKCKPLTMNIRCSPLYFLCPSGECVPMNSLCDGFPDCEDKTDEVLFCHLTIEGKRQKLAFHYLHRV